MKRDLFKKLMAASLATVMTVGLAGCGNEPASTNSSESTPDKVEESSTPSTEVVEEVEKYTVVNDPKTGEPWDLGGMEIEIYQWWTNTDEVVDDYSEARAEYREWIQDTYNFTIKEVGDGDWGECGNQLIEYVSTGGDDHNYVWVTRPITGTLSAAKQGLMYDLGSLDVFDFSDSKFANGWHNYFTIGGGIYAMRADACEPRGGIFFNKRLLEEAGFSEDYMYDLQANHEWTWDKWKEIMDAVQVDKDGDQVPDVWGTTQNDGNMISLSVYTNGGNYIDFVDGKFVFKIDDPKTMEALEFAKDILKNYSMPKENWDDYKQFFPNGQAAFMPEEVWAGQPNSFLAEMQDDWGFLCYPMGPNMTDYIGNFSDNLYCIPACYDEDRARKIAFAFDLYTDEVPGFEGYEGWMSGYAQTFDQRAIEETIATLRTNGMVPFHDMVPNINFGPDFLYSINGDADISALVEAIKEPWCTAIDEANAN